MHAFHRVSQQIEEHLLNLNPVYEHVMIARTAKLQTDMHRLLFRSYKCQRAGLFENFVQAFDSLLGLAARQKIAQPPNNLSGS